jgi:hypothetical protein
MNLYRRPFRGFDFLPNFIRKAKVMHGVIIVIPTQGDSVHAFEDSARKLNHALYHGRARIVRASVAPDGDSFVVTFKTSHGAPFVWADVHAGSLQTVVTISHSGEEDGPNLALLDATVNVMGHQPWGTVDGDGKELTSDATTFWATVGKALGKHGKTVLLGCNMGRGLYASLVASATGHPAFAATQSFAAGNSDVALKYTRGVESHHVMHPLKRFAPPKHK